MQKGTDTGQVVAPRTLPRSEIALMDTDRKREEVVANLENMAARIAELQEVMHEGGTPSEGTLDRLQQNVEQASDAIAAVLDPERARKP